MVCTKEIIIVLTILVTVMQVYALTDSCFCVSASYGCKANTQQMGQCDKRCCSESKIDPATGEKTKRECQCVNASSCPPEYPKSNGKCSDLVECCPTQTDL